MSNSSLIHNSFYLTWPSPVQCQGIYPLPPMSTEIFSAKINRISHTNHPFQSLAMLIFTLHSLLIPVMLHTQWDYSTIQVMSVVFCGNPQWWHLSKNLWMICKKNYMFLLSINDSEQEKITCKFAGLSVALYSFGISQLAITWAQLRISLGLAHVSVGGKV